MSFNKSPHSSFESSVTNYSFQRSTDLQMFHSTPDRSDRSEKSSLSVNESKETSILSDSLSTTGNFQLLRLLIQSINNFLLLLPPSQDPRLKEAKQKIESLTTNSDAAIEQIEDKFKETLALYRSMYHDWKLKDSDGSKKILHKENERLFKQMQNFREERDRFSEQLQIQSEEFEHAKKTILTLKEKLLESETNLSRFASEKDSIQKSLKMEMERTTKLTEELSEYMKEATRNVTQAHNTSENFQKQVQILNQELLKAKGDIEILKSDIDKERNERNELTESYQLEKGKLQETIHELKKLSQEYEFKFQEEIRNHQETKHQLGLKIITQTSENTKLESQLKELKNSLSSEREMHKDELIKKQISQSSQEETISRLQRQNSELNNIIPALKTELESEKTKRISQKEQLEDIIQELRSEQEKLYASKTEERQRFEKRINELKEIMNEQKETILKLESTLSIEKQDKENSRKENSSKFESLQLEISSLRNMNQSLKIQIEDWRKRHLETVEEFHSKSMTHKETKDALEKALKLEISELETEKKKLTQEVDNLKEKLKITESEEYIDLESTVSGLRSKLEITKSLNTELHQAMQRDQDKCKQFLGKIDEMREEIRKLKDRRNQELRDWEKETSALKFEISTLQEAKEELSKSLSTALKEKAELISHIEVQGERLHSQLNESRDDFEDEKRQLENSAKLMGISLNTSSEKIQKLEKELSELRKKYTSEVDTLQKELLNTESQSSEKLKELRDQITGLLKDSSQLREENFNLTIELKKYQNKSDNLLEKSLNLEEQNLNLGNLTKSMNESFERAQKSFKEQEQQLIEELQEARQDHESLLLQYETLKEENHVLKRENKSLLTHNLGLSRVTKDLNDSLEKEANNFRKESVESLEEIGKLKAKIVKLESKSLDLRNRISRIKTKNTKLVLLCEHEIRSRRQDRKNFQNDLEILRDQLGIEKKISEVQNENLVSPQKSIEDRIPEALKDDSSNTSEEPVINDAISPTNQDLETLFNEVLECIENVKLQNSENQIAVTSLSEKNSVLNEKLQSMENTRKKQSETIREYMNENASLVETLEKMREELAIIHAQRVQEGDLYKQKIEFAEEQIRKLFEEREDLLNQISELEKGCLVLQDEIAEERGKRQEEFESHTNLKNELEKSLSNLSQTHVSLQNIFNSDKENFIQENELLNSKILKLESSIKDQSESYEKVVTDLEGKYSIVEDELASVQHELSEKKSELEISKAKIANLEIQLKSTVDQLKEYELKIEDLTKIKQAQSEEISRTYDKLEKTSILLNKKISQHEDDSQNFSSEIQSLKDLYNIAQTEKDNLVQRLKDDIDTLSLSLQESQKTLEKERELNTDESNRNSTKIKELSDNIEILSKENSSLKQTLADEKDSATHESIELRGKINSLQNQVSILESENEVLQQRIKTSQQVITDKEAALNNAVSKIEETIASLKIEKEKNESTTKKLNNEISSLKSKVEILEAKITSLNEELDKEKSQSKLLTENLEFTIEKLKAKDEALTASEDRCSKLDSEIQNITADHEASILELNNSLSNARDEIAFLKESLSAEQSDFHSKENLFEQEKKLDNEKIASLTQMKEEYHDIIQLLTKKLSTAEESLRMEQESNRNSSNELAEKMQKVMEITEKLESDKNDAQLLVVKLQQEVTLLQETIEASQTDISKIFKSIPTSEKIFNNIDLKELISRLSTAVDKWKELNEKLKEEMEAKDEIISSLKTENSKVIESYEDKISQLSTENRKQKTIIELYEDKISELEGEVNDSEKATVQMINGLQVDLQNNVIVLDRQFLFKPSSADLQRQDYELLDRLAQVINQTGVTVRLESHAAKGSRPAQWYQDLTEQRCLRICAELELRGIPPKKLRIKAYGCSKADGGVPKKLEVRIVNTDQEKEMNKLKEGETELRSVVKQLTQELKQLKSKTRTSINFNS